MSTAAKLYDDGERKTLDEIRAAGHPRCTPEAIGVAFTVKAEAAGNPEAEAELRDTTDRLCAYLRAFLPPGPCVKCGATLGGSERDPLAAFLGTFTWGLAYGEGSCGRCGYPARGLHRIDLGEGASLELPAILQYHPDGLTPRSVPSGDHGGGNEGKETT